MLFSQYFSICLALWDSISTIMPKTPCYNWVVVVLSLLLLRLGWLGGFRSSLEWGSSLLRHLVVRMISIGSGLFPSWTTWFLCNQIAQRVVKTVWRKNIISWCRSLFLKMQSVSKLSIEIWAISEVLIAKEEQTKQLWPRGIIRIGVRMIRSLPCTWDGYCP